MSNFRLFTPYLSGATNFIRDLTRLVQDQVAVEGWQEGFVMQSFSLVAKPGNTEDAVLLMNGFNEWLGCHFEEQVDGEPVWDGLVCQMELATGRSRRRRSLIDTEKPMHNAVRAQYTAESLDESDELLENGNFSSLDAGVNVFASWEEVRSNGAITSQFSQASIQAGAGTNTYIYVRINVRELTKYRFSFWTSNSAAEGRYYVKDLTAGNFIQALTGTGGNATLSQVVLDFTTPLGCAGVELALYCPNVSGDIAIFDDASFKEYKDLVFDSAWATQDRSIDRYGRIEHTITESSQYTQAEAEQLRDMVLAERAWPNAFPVAISEEYEVGVVLDVVVCGYIVTADWQESTVTLGAADDASNVVNDLITTNQQYLTVGRIDSNTLQVETLDGLTARQRIAKVVAQGDASKTALWRAYVGSGREFFYVKVADLTPGLQLMADGLREQLSGPLLQPHEVRPGVVRDHTYPVGGQEEGSLLQDARDMLVSEVQRRQGEDFPDLRTSEVTEADIYAAQLAQEHK